MPSQLITNDNVSFICARDFTYNGVDYKMGEDFDQDIAVGRIELLVRTRRVIPVVDSYDVKPRHWHREVRLRSDVENRLGITSRDVAAPIYNNAPPQQGEQVAFDKNEGEKTTIDKTEGLGYDPSEHTIDEVMEYVEEHPEEVLSVYALEEQGKNRTRLKAKLDEILNHQAEVENEEDTNV